ncbi:hypothetical protein [Candidatus Synchoanobacter obligatus]|uniref:POTRA domain-containing protein n=1 Tax=Candidatus Synchoanobacter obligatus TaxID=2919597 RepID=A0ABT1L6G9_9GAMM|nr:hypothetical protein [Candidatus Synchoanobacter obligatus]MCP8352048.1 hypothetical protein [Candidatus Synchoanobacter obligatus]
MRSQKLAQSFVVLCLLLAVSFFYKSLPVKYVWYGADHKQLTTDFSSVGDWENAVKEWDWVDAYRLQWRFPNVLFLEVSSKVPAAKLSSGAYVSDNLDVFSVKGAFPDALPLLTVTKDSLFEAVLLLKKLSQVVEIRTMSQSRSGIVKVVTTSGDQLLFPSFSYVAEWDKAFKGFKDKKPVKCFFFHQEYATCQDT